MASSLITAPSARNLTRNPIYVTLQTDKMTGSSAPYVPSEDNLSNHLEVHLWADPVETKIATLHSPYSTDDKRTTYDISGILPKRIVLPSEASIDVSGSDPLYAEAVGLVDIFRLKHADKYGDPVVTETLTTSSDYLAIHGGLPADAVQSINYLGKLIGLHSYYHRRDSAYTFLKPVSKEQPDWIYFVALATGTVEVTVTIRYDDGTTAFYVAVEISVTENKAYWVQSGYNQLKIDDEANPAKTVVGYNVSLIHTGQNPFTAFYVLDQICTPWDRVFLYHNSFGGYETVRMRGQTRYSHAVEREVFRRTRWSDFTIKDGEIDQVRTEGSAVYNTHTGHYPSWYIEHLRQVLHGRLWLVDTREEEMRFKRIICRTDQADLRTDGAGPDGFAVTWAPAWLDDGFNIY